MALISSSRSSSSREGGHGRILLWKPLIISDTPLLVKRGAQFLFEDHTIGAWKKLVRVSLMPE